MTPAQLVSRARRAGLDRVAVTDHNAIAGAFAARALDPELVIIGEEIRCKCGTHLIGLFLQERIAPGQTLEETARGIRDQGGVVYAPHPFAYLRSASRRARRVLAVADVVEVFNSRAFLPAWNRRAAGASATAGLAVGTGTDAHAPWEIGRAYTELPAFHDAGSFLVAAAHARPRWIRTGSPFNHVLSLGIQGVRTVFGRGHGVPLLPDSWVSLPLAEERRGSG